MAVSVVATTVGGTSGLVSDGLPRVGPRSVAPANVQGNLLVVFAAWATLASYSMPAGSVADSQGNWWRCVADTGGATGTGIRAAAFACSNALAVQSWLSFCPQGYSTAFIFEVVELTGLPASYWPLLDFRVSATSASAASIAKSATTLQADYCFAATAVTGSNTITYAGTAGMTALGQHSTTGTSGDTIALNCAWGTYAAGATNSDNTWTISAATRVANLLFGISQASHLPVQSRPVFPRVTVEAAMAATPGDFSQAITDDLWVSLDTWALGKQGQQAIATSRGQQYELAQPESGSMSVAMNNQAGDFNPQNPGSALYSNALNSNFAMQDTTAPWTAHATSGVSNVSISTDSTVSYASGYGAVPRASTNVTVAAVSTTAPGISSEDIPVNINYVYSPSTVIYLPSGTQTGQVLINWYNSSHVLISSSTATSATLTAGTWTPISASGLVPPAGTAFMRVVSQVSGTFTAGLTFNVAETGVALGTSPVQTGLVRLGVPVRASCYWNGQRYPLGFGYVERWPQDWPDIPQWGWSTMIATDVVGVASSVNLPSAVQGEIYVEQPYYCFPFSEQYATPEGMAAGNTARGNSRQATYSGSPASVTLQTGQSMGLMGDSGTGIGATGTGAGGFSLTPLGAMYGPDPNMVQQPVTFEFWFQSSNTSPPAATTYMKMLDIMQAPNDMAFVATQNPGTGVTAPTGTAAPGVIGTIIIEYQISAGGPLLFLATNSGTSATATQQLNNNSVTESYNQFLPIPSHLITVEVSASSISVLIDGTAACSASYTPVEGNISTVVYGPLVGPVGVNYTTKDFSMSYAWAGSGIPPSYRTNARYIAGTLGFIGDTLTDRVLRYVAWAGLNLGLAGQADPDVPPNSVTKSEKVLGPAFSTAKSPLASALNSDCQSMGARWAGTANGNLVVLTRAAQLNQPPSATFGDSPAGSLNNNFRFVSGTSGWTTGNGATLQAIAAGFSATGTAIQVTPDGVTANPQMLPTATGTASTHIPVTQGSLYAWSVWTRSDQGWASGVQLIATWFNSSNVLLQTDTGPVLTLPSGSLASNPWQPVVLWRSAPATASYAIVYYQVIGTPASSTLFQVCHAPFRLATDQVPYQPSQGMDYDNSYLTNVVEASVQEGPNILSAWTIQDQTSAAQYFQRGPNNITMSGVTPGAAFDLANWNLNKYKQPSLRVRSIEVRPAATPLSFDSVLQTDVGDPATTIRDPLNSTKYQLPVVTQKVEHLIGPGIWISQYQQSPYTTEGSILSLDDTTGRATLGSNILGW